MKRTILAFALSIILHTVAFATVATIQLLNPPKKKTMQIMYIQPVTIPKTEIKKVEFPKQKVKPKPIIKKDVQVILDKISVLPKPTPTPLEPLKTHYPILTPPPIVFETPKPIKSKETIKLTKEEIKAQQDKQKIAILKKYPYFKNWSDARIKRLELPPGIKDWNEAVKLTEYFDTQYKWTYTPPALGDSKNNENNSDVNPYATPSPESTPIPDELPKWKEYKENSNDYSIRFYKDDIGFISYFRENEKKVTVSYFPFNPDSEVLEEENKVEIPENIKKEEIKEFSLPLTKEDLEARYNSEQDKILKDQLIRDILRTYNQKKTENNLNSN